MILRVRWKGRELPPDARGVVHSVFGRACNLRRRDGRFLALLGPDLPRLSWSLNLERLPAPFAETTAPGMAFRLDGDVLDVPDAGLRLRLNDARLWEGDRLPPDAPDALDALRNARRLLRLAEERRWPGFCALYGPDDADPALREGIRRREPDAALDAALALLGLGVGLTPAGDDFLGGFLAGLGGAPAATFGRKLKPLVRAGTTALSAAFLERACDGSFSEHLGTTARLLRVAAPGSELEDAARRLLAFGGTSGADALAGLIWGALG